MKRIEKLTAEHLLTYMPFNVPARLSIIGVFNQDNEYPSDNDYKIGYIHHLYISDEIGGSIKISDKYSHDFCEIDEIELVLRTRQSITPGELETFSICFRTWYDKPDFDYNLMVYSDVVQMAKLHIDIFGLIESGLAVDKETIKK